MECYTNASSYGKSGHCEAVSSLQNTTDLCSHQIEERTSALDDLQDQYDDFYDEQIDAINDYLSYEGQLYRDACAMIDDDNGTLYANLLSYSQLYTSTSEAEMQHMWNSAQTAMQTYNTENQTTFELMNTLQQKVYDVETAIEGVNEEIDAMADQIDAVSDQIEGVADSIDLVSDNINEISTSISNYKNQISTLEEEMDNITTAAQNAKTALEDVVELESDNVPTVNGEKARWYIENGYDGKTYYSTLLDEEEAYWDMIGAMMADWSAKYAGPTRLSDWTSKYPIDNIKHYASGTKSAKGGLSIVDEEGLASELIPTQVSNGRYTILPQGNPVFSKAMTNELFDFASDPLSYLNDMASDLKVNQGAFNDNRSVSSNISINIQGDATEATVKALKQQANAIVNQAVAKTMNTALKYSNISKT